MTRVLYRHILPGILAMFVHGCAAEQPPERPDDTGEASQPLDVGTSPASQSAQLFGVGDHYIHRVNILQGGQCSFATTLGTLPDSVLAVRDASNTTLGVNDDSGGTLASRVDLALAPGLYFADVGSFADAFSGSYTLTVQCTPAELGRISRWCGKVNIHEAPGGGWVTDSDCISGCDIGGLAYCRKFWPTTASIVQVSVSSKPNNVWNNRGCQQVIDDYDGDDEFVCRP